MPENSGFVNIKVTVIKKRMFSKNAEKLLGK
jgi:hypothetical protein